MLAASAGAYPVSKSKVVRQGTRLEDKATWQLTEDAGGFEELSFSADQIEMTAELLFGSGD